MPPAIAAIIAAIGAAIAAILAWVAQNWILVAMCIAMLMIVAMLWEIWKGLQRAFGGRPTPPAPVPPAPVPAPAEGD